MKNKKFDALEMKRQLQKEAELKLANLSEKKQIEHTLPPCLYPHTLTNPTSILRMPQNLFRRWHGRGLNQRVQ